MFAATNAKRAERSTMRPETEARIRNVQKFGKNGRQFCVLAGFFLGVYLLSQ